MSQLKLFARNSLFVLVLCTLVLSACAKAPTAQVTQPPAAETAETTNPPVVEATQPPAAEATQAPVATQAASALTPDRLVPEITFIFSTAEDDPVRNEIGIMLTNEWEKLGLRVKAQPTTYEKMVQIYTTGQGYNAFTLGYDGRPERLDPEVLLRRVFYTGLNYMNYSNPEYDELVDAQRAETDPEKRQELVFKAEALVAEDAPGYALYHDADLDVYNNELWDNIDLQPGQGVYNYWTLNDATPKTDQKVMRVAHVELPVNLNPFYETSGADTEVMRELYDTLARVGTDGLPKACAAESWENPDPTTINVTIRQGMKFNDGTPVTAKDVKFSYDIQKEKGSSIYKPFLKNVKSVDLVDDYHLTMHLESPDASIYMATFSQIYIIPEHIWSKVPDPLADYDNNTKPVGSGPYILDYWRPNEELKAVANKDYQFPVNPDAYMVIQYANSDAIFQSLVNQEADINYDPLNAVQADMAKNYPYLTLVNQPSHQVRIVGFNVALPPFSDQKFRDAIGYTIDYDTIVNVILKGAGIAGSGIISPVNEFWFNPDQKIRRYDITKARELLAAAGYEWDAEGLMYMPAPK